MFRVAVSPRREFSLAGELVSNKRSRMKPENVDMWIFLNKNKDRFWWISATSEDPDMLHNTASYQGTHCSLDTHWYNSARKELENQNYSQAKLCPHFLTSVRKMILTLLLLISSIYYGFQLRLVWSQIWHRTMRRQIRVHTVCCSSVYVSIIENYENPENY